ncbi:MAG: hypothetical protein J6L88_04540 [Clostridia bacterium]|nr:hypothetical protein [Clostridia bacterium]
MHPVIGVVIPAAVVAAVVVLLFMAKPAVCQRVLIGAVIICAALGILFYGVGYADIESKPSLAVIKTVYSLCRVFIGENDYADIASARGFDAVWVQSLLFMIHTVGLFSTVGAAISAFGAAWLRRMRLRLHTGGNLCLLLGTDEKTLGFAQALIKEEPDTILIFVDDTPHAECGEVIESMGALLFSDAAATEFSAGFLRMLRIRTRKKISFYALSDNYSANMKAASLLCESLKQMQVDPARTSLCAVGNDDDTDHPLLATADHYGFGSIVMRSEADMAARLLTLTYPPCTHIEFDENARALQDFHAVIIGFGQVGQAVLKSLIMNGQFAGSSFRAAVFAPDYTQTLGQMRYECSPLFDHYNIEFFADDARSLAMFDYLHQNKSSIRYVAVCAGNDTINEEIAHQLEHFFLRENSSAQVYLCTKKGISHHESREESRVHEVCVPKILCSDAIDRAAMALNHSYCGNDKTPQENWRTCDYFSRMSSRASADFAPCFMHMAHMDAAHWAPKGEVLENLSITEHERWCAFHYCMGFSPMADETFAARCETYTMQKEAGLRPIRIGKDLNARIHACLIGWDALDDLSARENAVTGGNVDYKQMDRNNVLTLPLVIRSQE